MAGVRKKLKNRLNWENWKNNWKNRTVKKNQLKFKKKTRPVRFGFCFIKLKPKKPNPNRKKLSQTEKKEPKTEKTEPNRFEPIFVLKKPNRTEYNILLDNCNFIQSSFYVFYEFYLPRTWILSLRHFNILVFNNCNMYAYVCNV